MRVERTQTPGSPGLFRTAPPTAVGAPPPERDPYRDRSVTSAWLDADAGNGCIAAALAAAEPGVASPGAGGDAQRLPAPL